MGFTVYSNSGNGWVSERSFPSYATACQYARQLEASTVRTTVRRGGAK